MEELSKRYSLPSSGYSSRMGPQQRVNDSGTDYLPFESFQSLYSDHLKSLPSSVSQMYEPGGRFDLKTTRRSVSSPPSPPPQKYEFERLVSRRCLSAPRYSPCLDASTFSQHLPKRKTTSSMQDVKLYKDTSLDQISIGCHASTRTPLYRKEMLPYTSEYWACTLPDSFLPSKDRTLPDWDPDEEYQALLDFTYPLRPGHFTSKDSLDGDYLSSDSYLKDSGIVADSFFPSLSNTLTSKSMLSSPAYQSSTSHPSNTTWGYSNRGESIDPPRCSSSPFYMYNQPFNVTFHPPYKTSTAPRPIVECSTINETQLSESLINSAIASGSTLATSIGDSSFLSKSPNEGFFNQLISGRNPAGVIPTTQILPLNKDWDSDEEYLTLPFKLNELEVLAQQLEDLSVHLDNKLTCATDTKGGIEKKTKDNEGGTEDILINHGNSAEATQLSCPLESGPTNTLKGSGSEDTITELKKASIFLKKLGRWPGSQLMSKRQFQQGSEEQNKDCLLVHVQNFSTKLEEMIQWLYEVVETTANWIPPQPKMDSIKSSLNVYMAFRSDVNEHRGLTESVLKSGEILLQSVADTTPVLKDTLELIAKQSKQLTGHAAHLYSSVLTAMNMAKDNLENKQQELEAAGLNGQSAQTVKMEGSLREDDV
ncbi:centrosomal protein of 68 kDa isoform X2 [Heptranchias perlo]